MAPYLPYLLPHTDLNQNSEGLAAIEREYDLRNWLPKGQRSWLLLLAEMEDKQ